MNRPLTISVSILIIVVIGYVIFEKIIVQNSERDTDIELLIETGLNQGEELYLNLHSDLQDQTARLADQLAAMIETRQNRQLIYRELNRHNFWGVMLYRDGEPWTWDGFNLIAIPGFFEEPDETVKTSVIKRNNVVLIVAQTAFSINEQPYRLLTAKKLEQTTNLPFGESATFNLSDDPSLKNLYPVNFNFFDPFPEEPFSYRVLQTTESDSAGVVYASHADLDKYESIRSEYFSQWRMFFHNSIFILLLFVFILFTIYKRSVLSIISQLILIFGAWFAAVQFGIAESWVTEYLFDEGTQKAETAILLAQYLLSAIFMILLSLVCLYSLKNLNNNTGSQIQFKGALLTLIFGGGSIFILLYFILNTHQLLIETGIPILDLELIPDPETSTFYIASILLFTSVAGIIISIGHFLFRFEDDKSVLIFITAAFGFISVSFIVHQFLLADIITGWMFLLAASMFLVFILASWALASYPHYFASMSGFRRLMIGLFVASVSIYTIIYHASSERLDYELLVVAEEYSEEVDGNENQILRDLLSSMARQLSFLSEEDFITSPGLVQVQFQRAIQSQIRPDQQNYQFDIQLIRPDGEQISDYSTSLDSPGWTALFDTDIMIASYRGEQIRRETNRPVIQSRPASVPEDYRSFYRGWIPIYDVDSPQNIIAWIFGAIYQERPDFNKPLRAMMAAATGDDWKRSYYLAEFQNSRVTRSAIMGIYTDQPEYNRLSDIESSIAMQDSIAHITTLTAQGVFRELLLKTGENTIIKASTPKPGYNNHLFSFFRLHIILTLFGLFVFAILSLLRFKSFSLFGQSKQFRDRLIDGLTLATLLFLTVLIFATQFAVGSQSEKNLERDLVHKLKNLSESVRTNSTMQGASLNVPLAQLASPLNVDAILYRNVWVSESTTPQIFQQHLIPRIMPFTVYEFLYNRERRHVISTVQLGDEKLLIGYRAILDDNNQPVGAIAIPTFVQSPVYTEQLLETTSYLFAIYLAIFFLFIVGSVLFSNRLTKPLQLVQQGLNKITRGEDQTKIPVSTEDEIGSLATAYNQMVQRLDDAKQELIKAERESAWKEMAQQVAHEIKNPLTPMKLNLQHLQRQLEQNPDDVVKLKPAIEKTAANVIEQIESLNKIASDFSKFARPVHEPFESVNYIDLVESVADLYNQDSNVDISIRSRHSSLTLDCVPDEIRRVLINLIKNGIEATDALPCKISISITKQGEKVITEIRDYGRGIPEEDRDKIFVPNFSTKSSGTGLGLAITKKIIEAHNGYIYFSSKLNSGTVFTIELPVKQQAD